MRILLVEDSQVVSRIIRHLLLQELDCEVDVAVDLASAERLLAQQSYFVAITDLNLPDAPDGEVVNRVLSYNTPCIVVTGSLDGDQRKRLLQLGIVDYVFKENRFSYEYVVKLVGRLQRNKEIKVLVADDSVVSRKFVRNLLEQHLFQVIEAVDGAQALTVLESQSDIQLLITDYNMPHVDGFELIIKVRESYAREDLAIIGLSNESDESLTARFIKNGADDFLQKPFVHEEFHCRVMNTMDSLEMLHSFWEQANLDYLTGVYNRRYFFEYLEARLPEYSKKGCGFNVALMDIDFFKRVNDTYGHDVGDEVLVTVCQRLLDTFGERFIVARLGGEEFAIALKGLDQQQAFTLVDSFRAKLAATPIETSKGLLEITLSTGIAVRHCDESIDALIHSADMGLYQAKELGRNLVCMAPDDCQ